MIHTTGRKFTEDEDAIIREHWGSSSSKLIGEMMDPPRSGDRIRVRARRLKLPSIGALFKDRPGNVNACKPVRPRGRRKPGVVPYRCLSAAVDGLPLFDPRTKAADFIRWREARA